MLPQSAYEIKKGNASQKNYCGIVPGRQWKVSKWMYLPPLPAGGSIVLASNPILALPIRSDSHLIPEKSRRGN